ncbi:hypothetical protein METHB2_50013 [Candidatus Methylobacter favarea]|uniref:Uncharacterized protein n=2 Tax=Candidatus Methylobacter favarea TaxID=2707345 RepID=A0A8S0X2A1_9GAMM|nr:hypothetical protein METHB2_50013 [Candidatus Methylobacter favarea]
MLDVRGLFSALVNADFIVTGAHFNGDEQGKITRKQSLKLNVLALLAECWRILRQWRERSHIII